MVDIVVVNWNAGAFLKKCIDSVLLSNNETLINKIIIIDNYSSDKSLDIISKHHKIEIIHNQQNVGFAKACNQGFKVCKAPFVLLLNPDAQLMTDNIKDCVSFMTANIDVDVLGCQLLDDNGKVSVSCARFPTPFKLVMDGIGLSKIAPKLFTPAILMTDWDHLQSKYVDQVMGAFMFMRINIFKKVGYFDERFFVYYEELDFSLRLSKLGGKVFYNEQIKAMHTGMGTTESIKAIRLFYNLRSRLQYAKKNFSSMGFITVCLSTFSVEIISRFIYLGLSGRFNEIKYLIKGYMILITTKRFLL